MTATAQKTGPTSTLTVEQARRAIYIDFEGRPGEAPALLGVLYAEGRASSASRLVLRQDILDSSLSALVGSVEINGVFRYLADSRSMAAAIHDVLLRAQAQDRHIVSWSQHELTTITEQGLSAADRAILRRWYVDGKATAKRWRRAIHPEVQFTFESSGGANKLIRYLDLVGYELPDTHGSGEVGKWIRDTRLAVAKRERWDALTDVQQRRWLYLLEHNANDCLGLRAVVMVAATELAAATALPA